MLHMVVNTHNPESCAFRGKAEEEALAPALDGFKDSGEETGVTVQGWWVNRAAHEIFLLVEAPGAHAIEDALLKAGLVGRTHSRIVPVITVDDAKD